MSVYDKAGLVELALALDGLGWELVASGGTAGALAQAGLAPVSVESLTGLAPMLGGRVKTLHPAVHGAILADRDDPTHRADLEAHGIDAFDLVVVNLYPFGERPGIETIDIGGPTMVRAAAKNHAHVGVVVDPTDYPIVTAELERLGKLSASTRRSLARKAFAHTAGFDRAVVAWFDRGGAGGEATSLPPTLHLDLQRAQDLRYGENPHQHGARYREVGARGWWDGVVQHAGTALSYLNVFDAEAAWRLVHDLGRLGAGAATVVVKHANPCGAAVASEAAGAYRLALEGDPVSAFGGIVAFDVVVTTEAAQAMAGGPQADVVVAPGYQPGVVEALQARRKATRILEAAPPGPPGLALRAVDGGYLVQEPDRVSMDRRSWRVVTRCVPTEAQWRDLELAWVVGAAAASNAVVVVAGGQLLGVGAGQSSRVESAAMAVARAGGRAAGGAAASDAFFPFRDGLDRVLGSGVAGVIQPGGSIRDDEVIAAADEHGIAMVLTGERHMRH